MWDLFFEGLNALWFDKFDVFDELLDTWKHRLCFRLSYAVVTDRLGVQEALEVLEEGDDKVINLHV